MISDLANLFLTFSVLFIALLAATQFFYHRYFRFIPLTNLSSSMLMGLGFFMLICFPEFGLPHFFLQLGALEIAIFWVYIIVNVAQAAIEGHLPFDHASNRLGMGASITATAIVALLLDKAEPLLHGSILFLAMVAIIWWMIYLVIVVRWIYQYFKKRTHIYVSQLILLPTIVLQVCLLMKGELFHRVIPTWVYQVIIFHGYLFYIFGFYAVVKYFLYVRSKKMLFAVSGVTTLLYSAVGITGLAMIMTNSYPAWMVSVTWWWMVAVFAIVESLEINRFIARIKLKGFSKAVFVYHPYQWLRIFSLTVLYGFAFIRIHELVVAKYLLAALVILQCVIMIKALINKNLRLAMCAIS